jgi:hypothetical protein
VTQIEIANGMIAKLVEANPEIDPTRFKLAYDVVVRSVEELLRLIPATVGKQVWVIPLESAGVARANRGEDRVSYTLGVLAVDRIDPPNEHLLNPDHADQLAAWVNDRIAWAHTKIRLPLTDPLFEPKAGAFCDEWQINELFDPELLTVHGIFWQDLDLAYLIEEPNAPAA